MRISDETNQRNWSIKLRAIRRWPLPDAAHKHMIDNSNSAPLAALFSCVFAQPSWSGIQDLAASHTERKRFPTASSIGIFAWWSAAKKFFQDWMLLAVFARRQITAARITPPILHSNSFLSATTAAKEEPTAHLRSIVTRSNNNCRVWMGDNTPAANMIDDINCRLMDGRVTVGCLWAL